MTNELNLLRSILYSDDHLQIRSSGDFNKICLKLNDDIQINFFIDLNIKSLTINNLHDLRIYKLTNSLKHDQWINIQDYFNELIQQSNSNTSIYSIIQLIQDKISKSISTEKFRDTNEIQFNLIQGIYYFNQLTNQWILCSDILSLSSDDLKIPSTDEMCIPKRCQFITWNIHSSEDCYTNERYKEILKRLESILPDIICLQEITNDFVNILLNEIWLKENNYYIIIQEQSCGELMLIKNIRPRAYSIYLFDKEYIIVRFGLNSKITIDIINIHLYKLIEKSSQILDYFLKKMNIQNYMIIGDFNFGDYDLIEETIIQKYKYQIHDLWKDIYDIEENPGYTFNVKHNTISLRSDRYLLHKLPNLSYSIEHLSIIDSINQSEHYALQLIINFRIRSISHRSGLVIFPTMNKSSLINQLSVHINLFCPFFDLINTEDDEKNIILPLRLLLVQYESFDIENNNLKNLSEDIKQLFLQCELEYKNSSIKIIKQNIQYIYIIQQSFDEDSILYNIVYQIPLGSVLKPIGLNQSDYISDELKEFFNKLNLYQNEKLFEQKKEKFNCLLNCFQKIFNKDTLHCFTYTYLPYGSFRLGLHGDDLDTVFVLSEEKSTNNKTNLDQTFFQLKSNPSELNNYIIKLLEMHIIDSLNNEIIDCRIIQAIYPIISILFNDQIRVEIFVQSIFNEQYQNKKNLLLNFHEPIHGVHDIERLITYVRFPSIFQYLLTFIRTWAQNIGLYGQVYGYLGGYSWAILCAYICHKYLPSINSFFSLEQFFILIENFFLIYSKFNWSCESLCLYSHHSSIDNRGSMKILCPNPPFNNTSRSTINSTRYLIIQAFKNACGKKCEDIIKLSNKFPDKTIQSIIQLTLSGKTINEINQWIGFMKSRLAHFLTDCEDECDLFVQTDSKIEIRKNDNFERFYSIGFQLNEQILSRHRQFYYCLKRFLDQFKICSFRSETMKISYKLMSIKDWNNERMKI